MKILVPWVFSSFFLNNGTEKVQETQKLHRISADLIAMGWSILYTQSKIPTVWAEDQPARIQTIQITKAKEVQQCLCLSSFLP